MSRGPSRWLHGIAAAVGGVLMGVGVAYLRSGLSLGAIFLTLFGFILLWWTISEYRKYQRGTDESEVGGGHTLE
jgi:1,4-dihydroxy-2-naphthoate octaprenyltransferase